MRRHNRQITLRIPEDLLQQILKASASLNENKSRFIKRSIVAYLDYHRNLAAFRHLPKFTDVAATQREQCEENKRNSK